MPDYFDNPVIKLISGIFAGFWAFVLFISLIAFIVGVFLIIVRWKVYQKCGKSGWEAIIPFYSSWVLVEICQLKWWFFFIINAGALLSILGLGVFIPFTGLVGLVGGFCCHYNLAKKFDKEPIAWGVGLTLLPFIFYAILAFSKDAVFKANIPVSPYGPFEEEQVNVTFNKTFDSKNKANKKTASKAKFCRKCGASAGSSDKFCAKCGKEI